MQVIPVTAVHRGFGTTSRRDKWWAAPLSVFLGLSLCLTYMTWAAFQGEYFESGPYLSPLYAPVLWGNSAHAWFGTSPPWWPGIIPFSPALLILPFPGVFRFTCYYYRGAYYKAFWADPVACAVGEPRKGYRGEHKWPLLIHNIHRYTFYLAALFIVILSYDAWVAMWWPAADGGTQFGMGVGTIVLTLNAVFLGCYTFGCHSARHLFGGVLDVMSGRKVTKKTYDCVSCLNRWHPKWAWISLIWVGLTDLYVRMLAMGVWTDYRFF